MDGQQNQWKAYYENKQRYYPVLLNAYDWVMESLKKEKVRAYERG